MQNGKLAELTRIGEICLTHPVIDLEAIASFCSCLKKSCEEMLDSQLFRGKKDEQAFCLQLVHMLIKITQGQTSAILSDLKLRDDEKTGKLVNLAYMGQSLIALTMIQHRFGGRLAYHCLPHSQGVAQYPDFMILCAGANHDAVMRFAKPPDFDDPKIVRLREAYHQNRSQLVNLEASASDTHRTMYALNKTKIKALKNLTEQKRIAGWTEGCSERDSFRQMELQLEQIMNIMEKCDKGSKCQEAIEQFKGQIKSQKCNRAALIQGTIPSKSDIALPGFGEKLNTIGNVSVFPEKAILEEMEPPLRSRLGHLLETMNEIILAARPSIIDPKKPIKDLPQEKLVKAMSEGIVRDAVEHRDMLLIDYLMKQMKTGIVANHDLGALMKAGAENEWLHYEFIGLIIEENPYQSQQFFTVNQKLLVEGGLADEAVHLKLRERGYRKKMGITDDEYRGALEFMDISFYLMNENLSFSEGAILRMQLFIYLPLKALQNASEAGYLQANIKAPDKTLLDQMLQEFEKCFCVKGKIRDFILKKIELMIEECFSAGSLCRNILSAIGHQFGPHFLKDPQEYGFTIGNGINKEFVEEQDKWRYE